MSKTAKTTTIAAVATLMLLAGIGVWRFAPRAGHQIVIPPVVGAQR